MTKQKPQKKDIFDFPAGSGAGFMSKKELQELQKWHEAKIRETVKRKKLRGYVNLGI